MKDTCRGAPCRTASVRTAFVVLDQDLGTSKGVGYVTFAIREDAQLAVGLVKFRE